MNYCGNQWGYSPLGTPVVIGGACLPPINLTATAEANNVTFSWVGQQNYLYFILEYRLFGSGTPYTIVNVYGMNITLQLAGNTEYEWRVTGVCKITPAPVNTGPVAGPPVTTGSPVTACPSADPVTITYEGDHYHVAWTAGANVMVYVLIIRILGQQNSFLELQTTDNFYDLFSLAAGIDYEIKVRTICPRDSGFTDSSWYPFLLSGAGNLKCPKIQSITTIISQTSIIASWVGPVVPGNYTYNVYLNNVLYAIGVSLTIISFTNLTPNTDYQIDIRTNCVDGYSPVVSTIVKTKKPDCPAPTGLNFTSITPTSFTANWTPAGGVVSQEIVLDNGTPIALTTGVNHYDFSALLSGSSHHVYVRSICADGKSSDLTDIVNLVGCGAVTGLQLTGGAFAIKATWNGVANATKYHVVVRLQSDNSIVYDQFTTQTAALILNLLSTTTYVVTVTAICGTDISPISSTDVVDTVSTSGRPACEAPVVTSATRTQTTLQASFHFASGIQSGIFTAKLVRISDNVTQTQEVHTIGTLFFDGLLPASAYWLYISNGSNCAEQLVSSIPGLGVCRPPVITSAVMSLYNTTLTVVFDPSPDGPPSYDILYALVGDDYPANPVNTATSPFSVAGLPPGRYKVKVRAHCGGSNSDFTQEVIACAMPTTVQFAVHGNSIEFSWDAVAGMSDWFVELNSFVSGKSTYHTTDNKITIDNLPYNTNFSAIVKAVCVSVPLLTADADPILFTTGRQLDETNPGKCDVPDFTAYIQDCAVTDPKDGGSGTSTSSSCTVDREDWEVVSGIFVPVTDDPPNDTFFEGTFETSQSLGDGIDGLLPGGILGQIREVSCRPGTTATLTLEILQGGVLITGDGTISVGGIITASGSYTSDGDSTLVIRIRGNYNKV